MPATRPTPARSTRAQARRPRAPSPLKPVSLAELKAMGATVNVPTAAAALGIGRATLYDAIAAGESPVRTLRVRKRLKVITASVIELLEPAGAKAGAA
jgi:hypothetical protein